MMSTPACDLLSDLLAKRGFQALVSGIDVPAWQHPVRGTAGPVPADRQHAPAGSDQHGADALDHPSSES
jgi:hypothetical protein